MAITDRAILLIQPPFYRLYKDSYSLDRYPLALGYLAGAVRAHTEWTVAAYNADFTPHSEPMTVRYRTGPGFENYRRNLRNLAAPVWQEVRAALERCRPAVVGISARSQDFASARNVARLAKEADPETLVVVGGPHVSMTGAEVLDCAEIDVGVVGEGEQTIVELLRAVEAGRSLVSIPGIVGRVGRDRIQTPAREYIDDLDTLGFPHATASEVLIDYARHPAAAFGYVFATRGCPRGCLFCGSHKIWSRRVRFRSPGNVTAELRALQERGLKFVHFDDDTFGVTRQHVHRLCEAIRTDCPDLRWSCELHVKLVDDETIRVMKSAGCRAMQLGIESGNNEILALAKKNITIEEATRACEVIKKHGIELQAFFMVGFPWETEATLRDTLAAIRSTPCDGISYSIFTPYPGTEIFRFCKENGLIGDEFDVALYNHQSPENCFSLNLSRERLRELVQEVETAVDQRNAQARRRHGPAATVLRKVREVGPGGTARAVLARLGRGARARQ